MTPISGYYLKENGWEKNGFNWKKGNDDLTYDGGVWELNDKIVKWAEQLEGICQHSFVAADKPDYEVCEKCGSYHSINQKPPKEIYESNYWSHEQNRSTFEEQIFNHTETDTAGISKIDKILEYIPKAPAILEVGPYPGQLLKTLNEGGYAVFGVEPKLEYAQEIKNYVPAAHIWVGYYPEIFAQTQDCIFDYIIAMDVVEHIDNYENLFAETHRLLKNGGKFIFMSPIIYEDGAYRDCDFQHPDEHCWIFTKKFLQTYLLNTFSSVKFDKWITGHEVVVCKK